jgi:hypothetical protein
VTPLVDRLEQQYAFLARQEGRAFVLAIAPYLDFLSTERRPRRVLKVLEAETQAALQVFVDEQNGYIEEAVAIRRELAERAPEIDNSALVKPDDASPARARYDLDSFAAFDQLVDRDIEIGYPTVPKDDGDPGQVSMLLVIVRGRLRAAQFGEDGPIEGENRRPDLDDLVRRASNLGERLDHSLRRYRHESRTLPGVAYARLRHFGTDLNPAPRLLEAEDDWVRLMQESFMEWGSPKSVIRKIANGERLRYWEERYSEELLALLKGEAERFQVDLLRRVGTVGRLERLLGAARAHTTTVVVSVVGTVVAAVILLYAFGIGR